MATWHCRVCSLEYSADDPTDLPWGADEKSPTYWICDCCGVEFGYEDSLPESVRRFRSEWLARGAPWFQPRAVPTGWNVDEQLKAVPVAYM